MPKEYINPPSLFRSRDHGFSQAVAASGTRTLYVSGQTAWDANKQLVGGADLADQARQAFRNVRTVVEASGGTIGDVVSLRIYVVDYRPEKAETIGNALRESFRGSAKPATTWIGVVSLADPGFLIEIEAIAVLE
ncbi:MAG: RidA family protein [Acidobacteria bacterium]|nr:MAG: RidA family protein [Acidobacteriota bacterium]